MAPATGRAGRGARRDRSARRPRARHGRRARTSARASSTSPCRASASRARRSSRSCSQPRSAQGISPQTHVRVEADGDQPRRQALGGAQLRERVPRDDRPHRRDDLLRQHGLRAADRAGRPEERRATAQRLGIPSPLDDYFAIGLGVEAVNPLEMARAFATFAQRRRAGRRLAAREPAAGGHAGRRREARRRRTSPSSEPVLEPEPERRSSPRCSRTSSQTGTGQARRARRPRRRRQDGTTENYGDAWFVGYTPQLAVAVWVGYPNKLEADADASSTASPVAGGTFPALIWKSFVTKALDKLGEPPEYFPAPSYPYAVAARRRLPRRPLATSTTATAGTAALVTYFAGFGADAAGAVQAERGRRAARHRRDARRREGPAREQPLTAEVITRPAQGGESARPRRGAVPRRGTLSSCDTVRIVVPKSTNGRIPDVVGLRARRGARRQLARAATSPGSCRPTPTGSPASSSRSTRRRGSPRPENMTVRLVVGR